MLHQLNLELSSLLDGLRAFRYPAVWAPVLGITLV